MSEGGKTSNPQGSLSPTTSVLLLDDDPDFVNVFGALLEDHGYAVTVVSDGVDGLKEVVSHDFDVIICDITLPYLPGNLFYLCVAKAKPHLCERFLFITAHQNSTATTKFLKHVDSLVLFKPIRIGDMLHSVSLVLARNRTRSSSLMAQG